MTIESYDEEIITSTSFLRPESADGNFRVNDDLPIEESGGGGGCECERKRTLKIHPSEI